MATAATEHGDTRGCHGQIPSRIALGVKAFSATAGASVNGGRLRRIDLARAAKYIAALEPAQMIPLAKYGLREIVFATIVFGTLAAAGVLTFAPAAVLPAAAWLGVLAFFRDPPRCSDAQGALLAPADGKVTDITPVAADSALGTAGVRIGIFMSIFDVHVNRSPFAATVERITHHDGGFIDARDPEAADKNESATILLRCQWRGREYPLLVRQVAGLIARRIVTDLRVGQEVSAGERIGMIKFGSRVELWVPDALAGELAVTAGQKVRAGRSAMARLPGPSAAEPPAASPAEAGRQETNA